MRRLNLMPKVKVGTFFMPVLFKILISNKFFKRLGLSLLIILQKMKKSNPQSRLPENEDNSQNSLHVADSYKNACHFNTIIKNINFSSYQ